MGEFEMGMELVDLDEFLTGDYLGSGELIVAFKINFR